METTVQPSADNQSQPDPEARIRYLETRLGHVQKDVRDLRQLLIQALLLGLLILGGLGALTLKLLLQ